MQLGEALLRFWRSWCAVAAPHHLAAHVGVGEAGAQLSLIQRQQVQPARIICSSCAQTAGFGSASLS
jgi:hypothetical protein